MSEINADDMPMSLPAAEEVVVRGLGDMCWKCHQPTTCIVAVHAARSRHSAEWVWFEDKHALSFARELLERVGERQLAGTMKDRFSRTAGGRYLSNGCQRCDAIQGDLPLARAISEYVLSGPLEELAVVARCSVTVATWQNVVVNQNMHRHGYPMTWDDMD